MKPLFSVVLIARNESKTLPRMGASLTEFKREGGEIILVDTGSTDDTPAVARSLGCTVFEEGARFARIIDADTAAGINSQFVAANEKPIVQEGNRLFDFSAARNYAVSRASNDWVVVVDCDEVFTRLNLCALAKAMEKPGVARIEHEFVFAHDQFGQPAIQFRMSRFYDRRKFHWNPECIVHEVLTNLVEVNADLLYLGPDVLKVEHWQNSQTNRSGYLVGLALDCFLHPKNDRNSHYFGRELFYRGYYHSAIQEFRRHIAMNGWPAERAQSMIYTGDCYKNLGQEENALDWWYRAFLADGARREPLMRLAHYFHVKDDKHKTAAYAAAALVLPRQGCYMDDESHYRQEPHELLYWALWYLGDKEGSAFHWRKAISYQPLYEKYLYDAQFYLSPGLNLNAFREAIKTQQPFSFVKLGDGELACMNGMTGANYDGQPYSPELARALKDAYGFLAGNAHVVHWNNQKAFNLLLHRTENNLAEVKAFWEAISDATRLKVFVGPARLRPVAQLLKSKFIEVPMVNAFGDLERVKERLFAFCKRDAILVFSAGALSKVLIAEMLKMRSDLTCIDAGSAFDPLFVGETRTFQAPKEKLERLYFSSPKQESHPQPFVSICIPTLGREEKLKRLLELIPQTAEYPNFEVLIEHDSFENRVGVPRLLKKMVEKSKGELVVFLGNDCVPKPGWLRLAVEAMREKFPLMDGLVGFNGGYWHGEENEHWLASKKLLPMLGGEFFCVEYQHIGCDSELTERCKQAGKFLWAEGVRVYHNHPMQPGFKPEDHDEVHALVQKFVAADRVTFKRRAAQFGFPCHESHPWPVEQAV